MYKTVGDFILYDTIGKGQFGSVRLAKKKSMKGYMPSNNDEFYACKIIPHSQNSISAENLEKEVEILSSLSHPNIIKMHQALKTTNNLYLFLDFCDQGDLRSFLKQFTRNQCKVQENSKAIMPTLNENESRYVITQVVEGLKYLNQHNIVHRDIKIDNILVKKKQPCPLREQNPQVPKKQESQSMNIEDYEFKVGDLGLAKAVGSPDDWIQTICGTPICMAPEVVTGCLYNCKADIWSLGTLLFNLITGTYPFFGTNIHELKESLRKGAYKIPRDVMVSIECIDFLNCCLKFDQVKRKDIQYLFSHPFLSRQQIDSLRENKINQRIQRAYTKQLKQYYIKNYEPQIQEGLFQGKVEYQQQQQNEKVQNYQDKKKIENPELPIFTYHLQHAHYLKPSDLNKPTENTKNLILTSLYRQKYFEFLDNASQIMAFALNYEKLTMVENDKRTNELYWIIDHDELCWAVGRFVKDAGSEIHVQCIDDQQMYAIDKPALEVHPSCLDGTPDLLSLGDFNEGALLHTIRTRHSRRQIYTSIGTPILISVNPYQKLKIFTTFIARKYRQFSNQVKAGSAPQEKPEPHLFMVAEDSYQDMFTYNKNQSIIISGESGAGKTEATKIVLKYLAQANTNFVSPVDIDMLDAKNYMASDNQSIEKQVLDTNPLLEAFGNAKTFKNNNSSRFGKFIRVNFEPSGKIHSATIINYLLEKSRIVFQQGVERNFHIFYQLISSPEFIHKYKLGRKEDYHYLNQSGVYTVDGIDDAEDFQLTLSCMKNIGFTDKEIEQLLNIVVAILLLGNIEFDKVAKSGVGDIAQISQTSLPLAQQICSLLQIQPIQFTKCLTTKIQIIGKETIESNLIQEEAYNTRDSMAKSIYGKVFNWIVERINQSISDKMNVKNQRNLKFIGLLDIFGFEIFQKNSFEQLCINYANEKLQQHFNHHMFNLEQEEYKSENIKWEQIKFVDNQICIDLIELVKQNVPSVFKLLDEEGMIKGTDQKLLKKMNDMLSANKYYKRPNKFGSEEFIVCHYAGEVAYDINGFIEKNRDSLSEVINKALSQSQSELISKLYLQDAQDAQGPGQQKQGQFGQVKPQGGGLKGNSLSNQFRTQLHELMFILKESHPRYIRCIKPNSRFTPHDFDSHDVCKQLRCAGMLEAIRIRKAGYAIRVTQDDFGKRYRAILDKRKLNNLMKANSSHKQLCEAIFKEVQQFKEYRKILDPNEKRWQIGITRVFMKEDVKVALEATMGLAVLAQAKHIQKLWKGFKARKLFKQMLKADKFIKKYIKKFYLRRKFRKVVAKFVHNMRTRIIKIQRTLKWRIRHFRVYKEIARRIQQKKLEAEKKRQEEERRRRAQEEMEMKKRLMQEQQESIKIQNLDNENRKLQENTISSSTEMQQNNYDSFGDDSRIVSGRKDSSNLLNSAKRPPVSQNKQESTRKSGQMNDSQIRFGQNITKLEQFLSGDLDDLQDLQQTLNEKIEENNSLKTENEQLRRELSEKDKKIKELNIRLETQKKLQNNKASRELEQILNNQDLSKIEMSFMDIRDSVRASHYIRSPRSGQTPGMTPGNNITADLEKALEQKDEEIQKLSNKIDILEVELRSKENIIEQTKEENESFQEKNKKWISKFNQQIDSHNQQVSHLTKQIKDLQEKNSKIEFEYKERIFEYEKKAFKDQSDEIKRLDQQLREKQDIIEDIELQKFNIEEKLVKEQAHYQTMHDSYKRQMHDLEGKYNFVKEELERIEEQLIEKDEMVKKYEEDCQLQMEQIKIMQMQLENLGDNKTTLMETAEQERIMQNINNQKLKELQREVEKYKSIEKVKQTEIDNFKQQNDKLKRKIKELEDEQEEMIEKTNQLKMEKAELERKMLFQESDNNNGQDFEKIKLKEKSEELERKLNKKKQKYKVLNVENNFYHQTTTLFLTIKKIIEKEKKFCFMMAQEQDVLKKKQLMDGINLCQEKGKQLDSKLKKILLSARQAQQSQVQQK